MRAIVTIDARSTAPTPGELKAQIIRIRQGFDRRPPSAK